MHRKPFIRVLMLLVFLASAAQAPILAYGAEPITLGVLAFPSKAQAKAQWQPLAGVLKQAMPARDFVVVALSHAELDQAVAARQLDFVLTNAGHYVLLRNRNGLSSPLATLASDGTGQSLTVYGGVIFSRAGQADINTLSDIKGKTVAAAVATESQGAYQMQAYELSRVGIRLPQDVKLITNGFQPDQVVEAVLAGRAEVGFVRSGVLEGMVREGKLDIKQLKILNRQDLPEFPFQVSTRLYPEWPFAVMPHIDENLARHVAVTLFELDENKAATRAMGINGFVVPADYSPVEDVLRELRMPPFEVAPRFTLQDVWARYRWQNVGALLAGGLILSLGVSVLLMYRRLAASHKAVLLHQHKLQEGEEKFRTVADYTYAWEIWEDPAGSCLYCSPSCERVTGYSSEAFMADSGLLARLIHPEDLPLWKAHYDAVHDGNTEVQKTVKGHANELEFRILLPDGEVRWIGHLCYHVHDAEGHDLGYRISNRDITEEKQTADVLRRANNNLSLFRKLLDNSSDAIEVIDPITLQYLDVNETGCRALGYSREELLAMSVFDIDPDLGPDKLKLIEERMRQSGAACIESIHRRKDGSTFSVEISIKSITLDKPYSLNIVRDITERKQMMEALRQREEKFRALVESTSDWIWEVGRNGHYTYVSPQVEMLLGYKQEEVLGKLPFDFMPPEEVQRFGKIFGETIAKRAPLVALKNNNLHKDGRLVVLETSGVPFFDQNGEFAGYRGIDRDITERQQAEQALAEADLRFKAIFNAAIDGILVADAQSHALVMGNSASCDMLGYQLEELTRLGIEDIHPAAALPEVLRQLERQVKGEIRVAPDLPVQRKDGSVFFADVSTTPMVLAGRPLLVGVFHDVTERKKVKEKICKLNEGLEEKVRARTQQLLEAQEELVRKEKLAVLGQVAGSVGHELRNPLAVMSNAVYFLETVLSDADETTREYLNIIKDEIADSERIVSDLLDSVRTKPPHPEIVGVAELLEQTLCKYTVPPSVTVKLDIPATLPPLRVDAMQIQQVFSNLISNGVEAMPEGGELDIGAVENKQDGTLTVSVRDSGSGITPEVLVKLFQPLFTTKARGIGLGLMVVKNLTQVNGGTIRVQSGTGQGTTFIVTLPSINSSIEVS